MGSKGSGPGPSQDWALLLAQYEADYEPHKVTLREFFKEKGIPEKTGSNAFLREKARTALAAFHDKNKPLLLGAQRMVMQSLIDSVDWPDQAKAAMFQLKVLEIVAEREEPNPLLVQQTQVVLPPMFPQSSLAAKAIELLTSGEKPAKRKDGEG